MKLFKKYFKFHNWSGIFCLFWLLLNPAFAKVDLNSVRVWDAPDNIRVVFDISQTPKYKIFTLTHPNRVVIDFEDTTWAAGSKPSLDSSNIKNFRYGLRHQKDLRVVLELTEPVKPQSFVLAPNQPYGYRLVLDLPFKHKRVESISKFDSTSRKFRNRDYIIAIDPGHGGEDPGAVGRRYKTKEKDIVLKVSKVLEKKINDTPGMRAYLIRKGDYYIGLRQRMTRARSQGADLFISIHADSFKDPKANGASVFILSEKGESSEAARWLAERENRADLIGGVSLDDKGDILAQVLLDLSQSASKAVSYEVANSVINSLAKVTHLHQKSVQQAGFAVLKSPDIPSILVELGFISNPKGEINLRKNYYQDKLAQALLEGIKNYFNNKGQPLQKSLPTPIYARTHKVRKGDSLDKIAIRYNTSVRSLKAKNNLKSDMIRIGQVLELPEIN